VTDLAYQLQTLGRARSWRRGRLLAALERLNAQDWRIAKVRPWGYYIATCTPQPQDCGPLPSE
jgi:hypothetical protein